VLDPLHRFRAGRGHTNDRDALTLQQTARGGQEVRAVVDDQASQYATRIAGHLVTGHSC